MNRTDDSARFSLAQLAAQADVAPRSSAGSPHLLPAAPLSGPAPQPLLGLSLAGETTAPPVASARPRPGAPSTTWRIAVVAAAIMFGAGLTTGHLLPEAGPATAPAPTAEATATAAPSIKPLEDAEVARTDVTLSRLNPEALAQGATPDEKPTAPAPPAPKPRWKAPAAARKAPEKPAPTAAPPKPKPMKKAPATPCGCPGHDLVCLAECATWS